VWLDDERAKAVSAAKDGSVTLKVPKGFHVIRVSAHGMTVERPYHVVKSKVHDMTINLVWERRQEYVSRALERQVDEVSEYITKPPRGSGTVAAAAAASASTAVAPVTAPAVMRSTTNPAPERKPDAGIEISLEDTPIAEPIPSAPAPLTRPLPVAAPTAPPHSPARQTLNLKPLSPEMAQTILPSTLSKPSQSSFRGSTLPPANESSDIVDLLPAADEAPPVDLGPPLDLESNDKTDPSLAQPTPPTHRR
jgi:hypothetical protein